MVLPWSKKTIAKNTLTNCLIRKHTFEKEIHAYIHSLELENKIATKDIKLRKILINKSKDLLKESQKDQDDFLKKYAPPEYQLLLKSKKKKPRSKTRTFRK